VEIEFIRLRVTLSVETSPRWIDLVTADQRVAVANRVRTTPDLEDRRLAFEGRSEGKR